MISIRAERAEDQTDIQNVIAAATATLRQTYRPNQRAIDNKRRISTSLKRIVAVTDGRVVGIVQYYNKSRCVRGIGLGVHTDYRRKGIARCLIHHLEKIAIAEGATRLELHTVKETGNVAIFRRLGFTDVAERNNDLFESDRFEKLTEVEMIKQLPIPERIK